METFEVLPRFTEFHHSQLSDERKSRSRRARNKGSAHVHTGDNSSVNKVHTRARARRPLTLNLSGFARHRCSFFPLYIYPSLLSKTKTFFHPLDSSITSRAFHPHVIASIVRAYLRAAFTREHRVIRGSFNIQRTFFLNVGSTFARYQNF